GRPGVFLALAADEGAVFDPGDVVGVGPCQPGIGAFGGIQAPQCTGRLEPGTQIRGLLGRTVAPMDGIGLGERRNPGNPACETFVFDPGWCSCPRNDRSMTVELRVLRAHRVHRPLSPHGKISLRSQPHVSTTVDTPGRACGRQALCRRLQQRTAWPAACPIRATPPRRGTNMGTAMNEIENVAQYMRDHKLLLVTAESCTSGLIAATLADIPGAGA